MAASIAAAGGRRQTLILEAFFDQAQIKAQAGVLSYLSRLFPFKPFLLSCFCFCFVSFAYSPLPFDSSLFGFCCRMDGWSAWGEGHSSLFSFFFERLIN